jgi:hypothetical protein
MRVGDRVNESVGVDIAGAGYDHLAAIVERKLNVAHGLRER